MKRYLEFFEPGVHDSVLGPIERASKAGARKALVVDTGADGAEITRTLQRTGISCTEKQMTTFRPSDIDGADMVVIAGGDSVDVSRTLQACIGADIAVIAPVTGHHCSKRTVFLMAIPKAGTHMVIRLFGLMGLDRSPDHAPRPGTWSTPIGYEYHAPCRELLANDWFDPIGRQLLFRSPALFIYRNPLDIVVSELDWFMRPGHAFSGYLNNYQDESGKLEKLIADDTVMGNIRDRINRYAGWVNFSNVIPVSYEELVGERGGGNDAEQLETIWALQLKLHVPGNPLEYGARLYDTASATFSRGRIGRYAECFRERHFALLDSMPQDFMQALGYDRGSRISSKVMEWRRRPLAIMEPSRDQLYMARLVREGLMGWNIIEVAGKYYPIQQGQHVNSAAEAEIIAAGQEGYASLRDAEYAIIHRRTLDLAARLDSIDDSLNRLNGEVKKIETELFSIKKKTWKHIFGKVFKRFGGTK